MISSLRLTQELVDQVVFGMENQDSDYVLDTEEGEVIAIDLVDEASDPERYVAIPEWRSVDGYNLMERFVSSLHNPIFRERLRQILGSGKGVFRQFKDALHERPEIERRWFTFKEAYMRDLVTTWFSDLRERNGLERLAAESINDETDSLIHADFVFEWAGPEVARDIQAVARQSITEAFPHFGEEMIDIFVAHATAGRPAADASESRVLVAGAGTGDWVAFLWAVVRSGPRRAVAFVVDLYVQPEYRGLGLARELLFEFARRANAEGITDMVVELPGASMDLESKFTEYGLERHSVSFRLDVPRWYQDQLVP